MGAPETLLVGSSCEAREFQERRITAARPYKWHAAAPLSPLATGDATNNLERVAETPPAVCRSALRMATSFLRPPCQTGAPATTNADDSLGFAHVVSIALSCIGGL